MKVSLLFFIILLYSTSTLSDNMQADSLKAILDYAKTQKERMNSCLNIENYYRNMLFKDSVPLTRILLEEGIKARNGYVISDALRKLVMGINRKKRVLTNDSVIYCLTGIGIPADKQELVFERFSKLDDFKPGNGLGLYICRLIVTRLGGTIHIDSEYKEGTSFVITFVNG